MRNTLVEDVVPLAYLPNLDTLDVGESWVRDLTPLETAPVLRRLDLGTTWIASLEPLRAMPALGWVNLHGAFATDGSKGHYDALAAKGVTVNNGRAFREDYRPGFVFRQRVRLERLMRRCAWALA